MNNMKKDKVSSIYGIQKKYYNGEKVDSLKGDIILTYGGRNIGKSYYRKKQLLEKAIKTKGKEGFGYWRRKEKEIGTSAPTEYFRNMEEFIIEWTNGEYNIVTYKSGKGKELYLCSLKEDKPKYSPYSIGRAFALSIDEQYKSLEFPNITANIFEEVFTRNGYLSDEPTRVLNLYSTIKREKEYCPLYMICNTVSKVNPYINDWALTNLSRQEQGTIDEYKLYQGVFDKLGNEKFYKIITEYCAENENESFTNKISKAFGRTKAIATGQWESDIYYTLKKSEIDRYNQYEELYRFVFAYNDFKFLCKVISDSVTNNLFVYVERKTTELKEETRIISNQYFPTFLYTKTFIPICGGDKVAFDLIKKGCLIYADNLTGTDFNQCLKNYNN